MVLACLRIVAQFFRHAAITRSRVNRTTLILNYKGGRREAILNLCRAALNDLRLVDFLSTGNAAFGRRRYYDVIQQGYCRLRANVTISDRFVNYRARTRATVIRSEIRLTSANRDSEHRRIVLYVARDLGLYIMIHANEDQVIVGARDHIVYALRDFGLIKRLMIDRGLADFVRDRIRRFLLQVCNEAVAPIILLNRAYRMDVRELRDLRPLRIGREAFLVDFKSRPDFFGLNFHLLDRAILFVRQVSVLVGGEGRRFFNVVSDQVDMDVRRSGARAARSSVYNVRAGDAAFFYDHDAGLKRIRDGRSFDLFVNLGQRSSRVRYHVTIYQDKIGHVARARDFMAIVSTVRFREIASRSVLRFSARVVRAAATIAVRAIRLRSFLNSNVKVVPARFQFRMTIRDFRDLVILDGKRFRDRRQVDALSNRSAFAKDHFLRVRATARLMATSNFVRINIIGARCGIRVLRVFQVGGVHFPTVRLRAIIADRLAKILRRNKHPIMVAIRTVGEILDQGARTRHRGHRAWGISLLRGWWFGLVVGW